MLKLTTNGAGEPPAAKFLREQMAEAAKDPVKFAEMMSKMQSGPTPETMAQAQQQQIAAQQEAQKKAQELNVWMGVYLERVKTLAQDKGCPGEGDLLDAQFAFATLLANKAVAVATESARL